MRDKRKPGARRSWHGGRGERSSTIARMPVPGAEARQRRRVFVRDIETAIRIPITGWCLLNEPRSQADERALCQARRNAWNRLPPAWGPPFSFSKRRRLPHPTRSSILDPHLQSYPVRRPGGSLSLDSHVFRPAGSRPDPDHLTVTPGLAH